MAIRVDWNELLGGEAMFDIHIAFKDRSRVQGGAVLNLKEAIKLRGELDRAIWAYSDATEEADRRKK